MNLNYIIIIDHYIEKDYFNLTIHDTSSLEPHSCISPLETASDITFNELCFIINNWTIKYNLDENMLISVLNLRDNTWARDGKYKRIPLKDFLLYEDKLDLNNY